MVHLKVIRQPTECLLDGVKHFTFQTETLENALKAYLRS